MVGIELFEPLIPLSQRSSPEWQSWCKLVELVRKLLLPNMTRLDVKEAARLDLEHSHLYQQVISSAESPTLALTHGVYLYLRCLSTSAPRYKSTTQRATSYGTYS